MSILKVSENEINQLMDDKRDVKELILSETQTILEKKKRGRPKKIKVEDTKKPVGRPKSKNDIKTRRLLYGITFFGKLLGVDEKVLEEKKKEICSKVELPKVEISGKDSNKEFIV